MHLIVFKLGGSLMREPALFRQALSNLAIVGSVRPIVIVPGGGAFADHVRALQPELGLSEEAAHWYFLCDDPNMRRSDRREFVKWMRRSPENIAELFKTKMQRRAL